MSIKYIVRRFLDSLGRAVVSGPLRSTATQLRRELASYHSHFESAQRYKSMNPLLRHSRKYFSQNQEDGIMMEVLRRTGLIEPGLFVEFGVGNGLENNTLVLLALGWRGAWIGGEELAFNSDVSGSRLRYTQAWITLENVVSTCVELLAKFGCGLSDVNVASIDLDGNDYHFVQGLLAAGLKPVVFVVEYNPKFPPQAEFVMPYNSAHQWAHDDYYGASLLSWSKLLTDYRLVACDLKGVNAFYVRRDCENAFCDVPNDLAELYIPGHYSPFWETPLVGHPCSPQTVEHFISQ
jgi:hypothetical protein